MRCQTEIIKQSLYINISIGFSKDISPSKLIYKQKLLSKILERTDIFISDWYFCNPK